MLGVLQGVFGYLRMDTEHLVPNGRLDPRFLRHDIPAGISLSFMSIAFALGIASISSYHPMGGIVTALIGGVVMGILGGSYYGICASGAGLAPLMASAVMNLGYGDVDLGIARASVGLPLVGILMWYIGYKKKATVFASLCTEALITGALGAIAVILAISRFGAFMGVKFTARDTWGIVFEAPSHFGQIPENLHVACTTVFIFAALIGFAQLSAYGKKREKKGFWWNLVKHSPPQISVLPIAIAIGYSLDFTPWQRTQLPPHFTDGLISPSVFLGAAYAILITPDLWFAYGKLVFTCLAVDGSEGIAAMLGLDNQDRYKRRSDPDRVLVSQGISNILCGFVGALPAVIGIAKSTKCITIGGRTAWAGIINTFFVFLWVIFFTDVINHVPTSALAAIIVYTLCTKLLHPDRLRKLYHAGLDQLGVAITAFSFSLYSGDIFWGILLGMLAQVGIVAGFAIWASWKLMPETTLPGVLENAWALWKNHSVEFTTEHDGVHAHFKGAWLFNHSPEKALAEVVDLPGTLHIHFAGGILLADHPTLSRVHAFAERHGAVLHVCPSLWAVSGHQHATRIRLQPALMAA